MNRNEQGLTLIEVLATITILSFISILIWNVFFQGQQFSKTSMKKNNMQQEANIIVTSLVRFHQITKENYQINVSDCTITVFNSSEQKEFKHPQLCLSSNYTGIVEPNKHDINLTITVTDKNDTSNEVSINTVLYRLKGDEQ